MAKFKIGDRVRKNAGVEQRGVVIAPFYGPYTDGQYRTPDGKLEMRNAVYVKWDDGTKGWLASQYLTKE